MVKEKIMIKIEGMHCAAYARAIEKALKRERGILNVNVNFATKEAVVEYESKSISPRRITAVIRRTGYEPIEVFREGRSFKRISFEILGMRCASCAITIEKTLKKMKGVKSARVNFANKRATIEYDPSILSVIDLKRAIQNIGYDVELEEETDQSIEEMKNAYRRMVIAWAFTIPIILWMIPEMVFGLA